MVGLEPSWVRGERSPKRLRMYRKGGVNWNEMRVLETSEHRREQENYCLMGTEFLFQMMEIDAIS